MKIKLIYAKHLEISKRPIYVCAVIIRVEVMSTILCII